MDYRKKIIEKALTPFPRPRGSGIVNSIIDNLPLEVHYPGYEFLGPGTNLDLKLSQQVKPLNKLDEAARNHDIAYAESSDVDKRHEADYKLQEDAWKRVIADDSDLGEKAAAYLTTNAMKVKRWLGAGIKFPINLDEKDQKLILEGIQLNKPVTLNLDHNQLIRTKESVMNETYLPLSKYQIKQVKKAIKNKKPVKLELKNPQLQFINDNNKTGGFLPSITEVVSNFVNAYENKKANNKLVEERIKQNKSIEAAYGLGLIDEFINHHKNIQAAEKKLAGTGFYIDPDKAGKGVIQKKIDRFEDSYKTFVRYRIDKICKRIKNSIL